MYTQGLSWRPRPAFDVVWRDASVRAGDRGRAGCAHHRGRGQLPRAPGGNVEIRPRPYRADAPGPDDGQVPDRLLDPANSGIRLYRPADGRDWHVMDRYTGVRESGVGLFVEPAAGAL